jgi:hypothetical protein
MLKLSLTPFFEPYHKQLTIREGLGVGMNGSARRAAWRECFSPGDSARLLPKRS